MLYINVNLSRVRLRGAARHFEYIYFDIGYPRNRCQPHQKKKKKRNAKQKPNFRNFLFTCTG